MSSDDRYPIRVSFFGCWTAASWNKCQNKLAHASSTILILMDLLMPVATYFHLITLSALASTFGGIVRPICLAALRLITNSNFVGCSTGRSAGLVPFSILST